jgi:hypothetical protein
MRDCRTNPLRQRLLCNQFWFVINLLGLKMRRVLHIQISACHHSSRYILKITTRKAYARLKTSVFLRSVNVKDSIGEDFDIVFFIEHSFQPCTPNKVMHTPISGVIKLVYRVSGKYGVRLLKIYFRNFERVNVFESPNLGIQC